MRKKVIDNPRYPHTVTIVRRELTEDNFGGGETVDTILYDGVGRSFTDTTTDGSGNVVTNMRKASIPIRFDEWQKGMNPLHGDTIEVSIGNIIESGTVRDSESDNNRTLVYWDFKRT